MNAAAASIAGGYLQQPCSRARLHTRALPQTLDKSGNKQHTAAYDASSDCTPLAACTHSMISASVSMWLDSLARCEDAVDQFLVLRNAVAFQPELHIRLAAHGADLDHLLHAEEVRGHAGVDAVGQHLVVLAIGLDDGSRMNAGSGAEGVVADHRIVLRNRHPRRLRHRVAIFLQLASGPGSSTARCPAASD